jgi:2-C-methyl-D-erythritol 4-phosphate cytidylyltransferase
MEKMKYIAFFSLGTSAIFLIGLFVFVKKEDDRLESYLSKNEVYLVQTPQAFNFKLILEAHEHARQLKIKQAIDDASLLTLMEQDVYVLPGSRYNFKVVTQDDLSLFKFIKEHA